MKLRQEMFGMSNKEIAALTFKIAFTILLAVAVAILYGLERGTL